MSILWFMFSVCVYGQIQGFIVELCLRDKFTIDFIG